ncbi:probable crossover junction endonuclease EME2 isoform X2 [Sorex araneus]|uniref:probable crossover junction endonuclease EME2 isoform X2 n=1 Tax=Sorex araneus TaxID=42254 RepID=UPI00243359C2|nr:probable crossover junction endonuclease EME2 isoform X2 [Sorex araneus]
MARPRPEVAATPEAAPVPPPRARGTAELAAADAGGAVGARGARARRRAPTWEISDSEPEDTPGAHAPAEASRPPRPDTALRRLTVRVDPAVLEDPGADLLLEALGALGCECLVEPQRQARSLRWSSSQPDPCPHSVPPVGRASEEQDVLQLLEPEEFLQGVWQLTQIHGRSCSVPWLCPEGPPRPHLAVVGLDAHLWSCQARAWEMQQPETLEAAASRPVVSWPEVDEALVLLQLWADVDVLLAASWRELAQHVCAITKALAQRPYNWALGCRRARGQRWLGAAGGLAAADHTVQPRQPGRGRCSGQRLPLSTPPAAGVCGLQHRARAPGPPGRPPCEGGRGHQGPGHAGPQSRARPCPPHLPLSHHDPARPPAGPGLLTVPLRPGLAPSRPLSTETSCV